VPTLSRDEHNRRTSTSPPLDGAAMAVRLKDSQRLGELPRGKGTALELDVRAAPGSAWPTGGLDIYQTPCTAPATGRGGGGGGGGGGGATHSRGSSSLGMGVGGTLSGGDDWMDSLAGAYTRPLFGSTSAHSLG
jgi:hypothetical protein